MSAPAAEALRPDIEPRPLAPPGSLAERLLGGRGPVPIPRAGDAGDPPERGPAALPATAFGTSGAEAEAKLARVVAGEGLVVSTGHQPVLFLGPLYVLYKALTAIELARRLEERWGVPVLPLFWIASDDHDWAEVAAATLLDPESRPVTLRLEPPPGHAERPVGPSPLGPAVADRIDEMSQLLPPSEFVPTYLEWMRDACREERSFAGAFATLLSRVLGSRSYAWLDAARPEVKAVSAEWFDEMLARPGSYLEAEGEGAAALRAAGEEPPIPELEGALPLFYDTGARRERLYLTDGGISAGRAGTPEPPETWRRRLAEDPAAFSPNVSSRPALESRLLPVCASVLGPGETAYWSQLPPLFATAGVPFPAIQPRAAWTLIEPRIRKLLDRFELDPEELADGGQGAVERRTGAARPAAVEAGLGGLRGAIGKALGPLEEAVGEELPGIRAAVGKARKGLFDAVGELEKQVDQEVRHRLEIEIGQIRRCAANLFPGGRPQERALSPFYYLSRYGDPLVDDLERATRAWLEASLAGPDPDG